MQIANQAYKSEEFFNLRAGSSRADRRVLFFVLIEIEMNVVNRRAPHCNYLFTTFESCTFEVHVIYIGTFKGMQVFITTQVEVYLLLLSNI